MATSFSASLGLNKPTPFDPSVTNSWGPLLNADDDIIDQAVAGSVSISLPAQAGYPTVTLTAQQGTAGQQFPTKRLILTGTLTQNTLVLLPQGRSLDFLVQNATTGAFSVTLGVTNNSGGVLGASAAVPQGSTASLYSDGTNVTPDTTAFAGVATAGAGGVSGQVLTSAGQSAAPSFVTPFLRSYLAGLTLSNDSGSPNTILDISAGVAADSTNSVAISLGALTKSTSGAWVAGSGNNGMGNGLTVAASTWYHVHAINVSAATTLTATSGSASVQLTGTFVNGQVVNVSGSVGGLTLSGSYVVTVSGISTITAGSAATSSGGASGTVTFADAYFDTSVTAANAPSGTVAYRRLGSIKTDSSAHILPFSQNGDEVLWTVPVLDVDNANIGSDVTYTLSVPPGVRVNAILQAGFNAPAAENLMILSPDVTAGNGADLANLGTAATAWARLSVRTNLLGQVTAVPGGGIFLFINTLGWIDTRGRSN